MTFYSPITTTAAAAADHDAYMAAMSASSSAGMPCSSAKTGNFRARRISASASK